MVLIYNLIKQYCEKNNLQTPTQIKNNYYEWSDQIMYVCYDVIEYRDFKKIYNKEIPFVAKILKIENVLLRNNVVFDTDIIPKGEIIWFIHIEKVKELTTLKKTYLDEFFKMIKDKFLESYSSDFILNNTEKFIIDKINTDSISPTYHIILHKHFSKILKELNQYNFKTILTVESIGLKEDKYILKWI